MRIWILKRFRILGQALLVIALVLAPLIFYSGTLDVFNLVKLWILWVFGLIAACVWLIWCLERGIWFPRFNLGYAACAFVLALGLATSLSVSPMTSLFGRYHRYGGFISTALYVITMFALVGLFWEQPGRLKTVVVGVAASCALVSIYALIQAAGMDPIEWSLGGGSPKLSLSTLGNPNFAGGYIAISLPFVIFLASSGTMLGRFVAGIGLLSLIGLWFTGSRGGIAGVTAGVAALTYFRRDELKLWMKRTIAGVVATILILAVLVIWHPGLDEPPGALEQLRVFQRASLIERQSYWRAGLLNFLDHPLIGTGPDTFYTVLGRYRPPGADAGGVLADKPHNIFIEYASSTGILGLGAYLALVCLALWYAVRAARIRDHPHRGLLVTFAASFVAYLSQGFFSIDVPPLAIMGWLGVGAIAVLADPRILKARTERDAVLAAKLRDKKAKSAAQDGTERLEVVAARNGRPVSSGVRVLQAGAAALTAGLIFLGSRPLIADVKARNAAASALEAQTSSGPGPALVVAIREISAAIELHPYEATYLETAAQYLLQLAGPSGPSERQEPLYRRASSLLSRAYRLEPDNLFLAMSLGRLHAQWARLGEGGSFETAQMWWERAVELEPQNWQVRYRFGAFLNEWGVRTRRPDIIRASIGHLETATQMRPEHAYLWKALGQSLLAAEDKRGARRALSRALALAPGDASTLELMKRATEV